jgi:hypothetical protein
MALSQLPGLQETEEQRRRRLAAEAVAAGQAPPAESTEAFRVEVGGVPTKTGGVTAQPGTDGVNLA